MPIYKCSKCGAAENTATGHYYKQLLADEEKPPLCSECYTGFWHGDFPKKTVTERGYVELYNGFYGPSDGSWGRAKS